MHLLSHFIPSPVDYNPQHGVHSALQRPQMPSATSRTRGGDNLQVRLGSCSCCFIDFLTLVGRHSHLFCLQCADTSGLSRASNASRQCPACGTQLNNGDDVVVQGLNPSEDYKTSILGGLSPTIIMEVSSRALAFYAYQSSQEMLFVSTRLEIIWLKTRQRLSRAPRQISDGKIHHYKSTNGPAHPRSKLSNQNIAREIARRVKPCRFHDPRY